MGKVKAWLQSLSFRTGVIVLLCCIPFYILSFAQMLLPISTAAKGALDYSLRTGQNMPIWRTDNTWRGGLPALEAVDKT